ncbi:MAG: sulfotransferase [Anaerolineales bacterium]|nr:sulfotransferase [Anaerolineales bacterium]
MTDTNEFYRPILVTGAHRSGTTWAGKMLAAGGETAYISEPLNVWHRPGVMRTPVENWYTYICSENEHTYLPALRETLTYHYHAWDEIKSLRSGKDLLRMGRDWSNFLKGRISKQRPLIKDPFAAFSVLWFAERLQSQVVITVRHPAAFASSLKRLSWSFDFQDLLKQPLLMRDWLEPYRDEMNAMPAADVIGQSSLLWRMIYQVVDTCRKNRSGIQIVRHEDLSLEPVVGYQALYASLGLQFTSRAKEAILKSSSSDNPKEISKNSVHSIKLNSRASLYNWKHRLTSEEIIRIRKLTEDVSTIYYPEGDWE